MYRFDLLIMPSNVIHKHDVAYNDIVSVEIQENKFEFDSSQNGGNSFEIVFIITL